MERDLLIQLYEWKARPDRKPLILLGARQVGKTWMMREFGRVAYQNVAYVNCDDDPLAKQLFEADYDVNRILLAVQAITGVRVQPATTLLIFDELQEAPRGLHCLKYFQEKAPQYHVMAAGSLLGLTLGSGQSFPVGKVDILHLYPMTFREFLRTVDPNGLAQVIDVADWGTIDLLSSKLIDLLRQYYFVGGMPEVVAGYVRDHDLADVRRRQQAILEAYHRDVSKHTGKTQSMRIRQVLTSLPSQLAKENRKFIYGLIRTGARAADYELAIQWLVDAGLVHRVIRVNELRQPLKFYEDASAFKLFLLDCGLLACMAGASAAQMLVGDNAFEEFQGAFTEQYVLQQLVALGITPYYWSHARSVGELDFVVETADGVVPIEVKSGRNVRSRSLSSFISSHPELPIRGLRFSMLPYVDQGWMRNVPLYALHKVL